MAILIQPVKVLIDYLPTSLCTFVHTLALHYYKQSNTVYTLFFYYYKSNKSLSWHIIKSFSESDLLLELEFELINSTSGSNLWHWNTLARHLNFLVPSQVRAPLLDLSYSPYYTEVQAACSGATAAPGAGTAISNASHLAM